MQKEATIQGYELTTQQEQVWRRGEAAWLWGAVRVRGELAVERLQGVVRELAAAEEVFRSGFTRLAGMDQPLQVLRDVSEVLVEVEEVEAAFVTEKIEQWGRRCEWDEAGEQWGVKVWRVGGGEETVVGMRMRSLCGDRETVRQVVEAILAGYERELLGFVAGEEERRVQCGDYGAWQKEVEAEEGAEGRSYWEREQQQELRLGLEHGVVGGEWRRRRVVVANEVGEQVARVAAGMGVSEEAVLLSVWQMLLWRHTEAEAVEVESYFDGRKYEDLRDGLGRYERYLPVSTRFDGRVPFEHIIKKTDEVLKEHVEWQEHYHGGEVRGAIGFEYLSWTREWAGAELSAAWDLLEERVGGQKLKLRVESEADRLWVELEYDDGVLREAAAEWLSEQYVQLLGEVSRVPERLVSEVALVSAREREQVLYGWNAPLVESEAAQSVVQLFEAQVEQRAEVVAVGCGGEQLSFGELNRRANQLAHYLRAHGVGPEVVVGLCLERSVEMVVGLLGILKAGGAYLPLDPNYPRPRLEYLLSDAQVPLVVTQQRLLERMPVLGRAITLDQEWETIVAASEENPEPVTTAENLAYVIYTSGSTGQPKGVMISHGNLQQLLYGLQQSVYSELGQQPLRVGWNASLSFDASVKQWVQLLAGHSIYLLGEEERLEAERVLECVQQHGMEVLDTTPGQLRTWLEAGLKAEHLAAVLVGGEAIDEQLWQELGALEELRFYNLYGPTECTVDATWSVVRGERAVLGQRLPHVSVYVLDEQLRLAPVGVRGELCIGGGGVGRGYLRRAELTAERYVPHPYSEVPGARLYRTGDEGRYLEDGRIEYLGRRDQQVKVRGYRIELGEIEAVLESHEAVRQAVVTVREEQQLVAYLVARRGVQLHESGVGERSEGYEVSAGLRVAQQNKNETDYLYREIFERRCYLQHGVSIERGDWVVDVGANIGLFSLQAAQLGAARVYAFEPLGPVCASLRQNARLGGGRIRVFEHGLSRAEGEAEFTYYPRYTMMSGQSEYADAAGEVEVIKRYLANEASGGSADAASLLKDADELLAGRFTGQVQQCQLRRLTDVLREEQVKRVDLLKIDVQRAEWDVLHGLEAEDWERIGQVVLEVHDWEGGSGRAAEIRELLQAKGYEVTVAQDELLVGTDRYNVYGVRLGYRENGRSHVVELEEEEWSSGGEWEVKEVREYARERLPEYMVPQRWVVLEQMPLTAHGKVDRERLPAPAAKRAAERETEGEWTPVEELVAGIWNEVLKQQVVTRSQSFFELGGHSLLATQVISRVREVFKVEIGLRRLFEDPTFGGFSYAIEEELRAGAGVMVPPLLPVTTEQREQWGGLLPLSFAQQRLWFLNQFEPESSSYNSFKALRLKGELQVDALERTLSEIIRRHEVLRTRFVGVGGEPRQEVLPAAPITLPVTDLSALDEAEREALMYESARAEKHEPFDLIHGPMLRVKLLRLAEQEHVVLFTMHHIVSDGWSLGVLIKEVATLYRVYSQGAESPLPELKVQYGDFAVWQRGWFQGEALERQLAYWSSQLGGELPVLELPADRVRPAVPSSRGALMKFRLSPGVSGGLKELSRREDVTLFMTLLAAFKTLLHRHSGQQDIVVGTAIANRNYAETEPLVGFFVNQLVLRTDLRGEPTFLELLQRVKEVCLGAYAHQDMPFEKLVEELQPERDLSRSPLFQVSFGLQNLPPAAARLGELELQPVSVESESVRYDLTLWLAEGRESFGLWWSYRDELFSAERIRWLQGRFERLLEEIVAQPEWRLSQFAVESREEEAGREAREAERRTALETGGVAELVAVDEVEGYELTAQQEQVWERAGETWLWGAVRVAGELELERVRRVVLELAASEEVLRSGFARLAGMEQPLQVLRAETTVKVEAEKSEATAALLEQWGRSGQWDEAEEQWSVKLWQVSGETMLAVRMSPLCGDRETVRSVIEEVIAGYEGELPGVDQGEVPRRVQYADYAAWQKEVREEEGAEGRAYWEREQQRSSGRELRLGLERAGVGGAWQRQRGAVGREVVEQVRRVAGTEGVSEAAVLLSAWQLLLWRHTEVEEVEVESRVGGRGYEELEGALGRYERWVPVRVQVRGESSWRELLRESAARLEEAEKWQEYCPGAGAGAGERIGFEYVTWTREWAGEELSARWERLEERVGGQKLKLRWESDESGLWVELEYDDGVLSCEAAEWLSEQYVQLLSEVSGAPEQLVSEVALVSAREREQVLYGWNSLPAVASEEAQSVVQLFEAQVERNADAIAISCGGEQLSFGELNVRANQLAHYLRAQGVGPEVVVGLCVERSVEMVVGLLGILKAGGAYLPLDPVYPQSRLEYMLADAQVQLVITQQSLLERLPVLGRAIALDQEWKTIVAESTDNLRPVTEAENLAYVIYTSGSTGQPKGVMISHGNLQQLLHGLQETVYGELGQQSLRIGWNASLSFDASVKQWVQLLSGHSIYLLGEEERLEAERVLEYVQQHGVQVLDTTPGQLRTWLEAGLREGEQLTAVLVGGEAIDEQLWQELAALEQLRFYNLYGPTECTVDATWSVVGGERAVLGQRLPHVSVYVLDEQMLPAPVGVRGELCIGGGGVGRGYLLRAELTAERYVPHPYSTVGGARLYRTGDEGRYLEDGRIEYLGRRDQQVKVRGYRIELGEIEAVLESYETVRQAVVTVRDEQLVGYVVGESSLGSEREAAADLRAYVRERLPEYMVPQRWVLLHELPLTTNGKVDRQALRAPSDVSETDWEQDEWTPAEELVAGIWCEVLKLKAVGRSDSFFDLGGHSLLATQVISRVREVLGVDLGLRRLFEEPTLRGFSRSIDEVRAGEKATVPLLQRLGPRERAQWNGLLPLSFAQQRLWFLDQLERGSPFYNNFRAIRLKGELQVEALERTLSEIVRRHEVLRTRFVNVGGEPRQEVLEAAPIKLAITDLSALDEVERETAVREMATAESREPFDLAHGPMLRVKLLQTSNEDYVVLLTMHHVVSDGWSVGLLIKEVAALYAAYSRGEESPLPELAVQYSDFALWQRGWLQDEELERQLVYWRKQLGDGTLPVLELPADRARPAVQSYRGARMGFRLSSQAGAGLRELSRREGVTLFMTLLAAFQTLLHRYSGQDEIVVGTDVANRNYHETEGLIGFFVNQLVMRTDLGGEPTFVELLRRVKEVCLGAYAHQDVPFEKLVEVLQPERDLGRSPLFQVKLVLQNAPRENLQLGSLQLGNVVVEGVTVRFDLALMLEERGDQLSGVVVYSTELFEEARMARMLRHFELLLQEIVSNPARRLWELPLLREEEQQQLLRDWNPTRAQSEEETTVTKLFEAQVERTPAALAIVNGAEQLSYEELNRRANQLAHYLREQGVGPEVVVGLCMQRSVEMVVGLLGILKAGGAYLPLDPAYPRQRVEYLLSDANAGMVLTQGRLVEQLPVHWGRTIAVDDEWAAIAEASTENPADKSEAQHLAYVIYTSGSTGRPKGVMITNGGLANYLQYATATYPFAADKGSPLHSTLSFDLTVTSLYAPLLVGGWAELMNEGAGLEEAWREGAGYGVVKLTPAHLSLLNGAEESAERLREWSTGLIVGGEALSWEQARAWVAAGVRVFNEYGPTETVVGSCVYELEEERGTNGGVPIGRPIYDTELYVLDQWQQPVAVGVKGEIYIGGAGLARGYWERSELTAERFVPHPYSEKGGERLYRTGDEGRYSEDGTIEYLGRRDQQVKVRGYRIELGEIEAVLESHGGVRQAIVSVTEEQQLVGYVVGESPLGSEREAGAKLSAYLGERLPKYMVPQRWVMLEQMPLTANGKVDRQKLPAPSAAGALEQDGEGEWTPAEELMAGIWTKVLKLDAVGRNDNFFDLGGHSLLATQVISRVRDVFGVDVDLRRLFEEPTLCGFSRSIAGELRVGQEVAVPALQRLGAEEHERWGGMLPLSFAQQRLWFLDQLEPESTSYIIFKAVRLKGELQIAALERTLSEVMRRHEVLRTQFVDVGGEPRQKVLPAEDIKLVVTDLSGLNETEREAAVLEAATAERRTPFDLAHGPLLRVKLLRLGEQEHVVLLTKHHIVSDGWSMGVLIREVATLYAAYSEGGESPLTELPVQYGDFAVWQRGWLQGEELERQLIYWRKQLGGPLPVLELPADRPRPAVQSYRGARMGLRLPEEVSAGLKELSRREGVTLFMTLLAAFQTLLHRYSGQEEIVVGTDVANRNYRETEGLIGFFVNQLVLRTDLSGEPMFVELLRRVKEVCLGAYAHQDVPFEKLVEELHPERDLSRAPLFQVKLVLQNAPRESLQLGGLQLGSVEVEGVTAKFDLMLTMVESNGLSGVLEFNTDLFDERSIRRFGERFGELLRSVVAEPAGRIGLLELETVTEREQKRARLAERRTLEQLEGYELTAQQEQVWERAGETWLWGAVRVARELELERVRRLVRELAATEEILRSGFARLAGMEQPLQVLRAVSAVRVEDGESEVTAELLEQWGRSGQWDEAEEQWSVKLWQVSGEETLFAVRMSPLCGDRETVRNVIVWVLAGYERELLGLDQDEAPRRVQYADYGAWQKEVREEEGAEGRANWEREQQRSSGRELRLGLERAGVGGAWQRQRVAVGSEVVEQVRRVAAAEEVSEVAVLLSAWQMLLWRHAEVEEVEVESRIGGRGYEELEGALGRYERWVPVRVGVRSESSWRELLRETGARLEEAEKWQEHFSGAGAGERIGFEYVTWTMKWAGEELSAQWERLEERVGGQKLKLRGESDESGLWMELEYDDGVLSDEAAEWLSEQYVQLLGEVSGAPEQLVSEVTLVSAREREQVLYGWNAPLHVEGEEAESVVQLFEAQVERTPAAVALIGEAEQLSYAELNGRANQLAHYLRVQGVGPEVVVGLCLERSVEMVVGLLGILKAGGAYLPLDPVYPQSRLEYMVADAKVQLVITQQRLLERLPMAGRVLALDQQWEAIATAESADNLPSLATTENLAYVIYTSGSTGQPKGVMLTTGGLVNYLQYATATYPFASGGGSPLHSTLSFDLTVTSLYAPLLVGGWTEVVSESRSLEEAWQERSGYSVVKLTPAHLRLLNGTEESTERLGAWSKGVIVGGEVLNWEQVRAWLGAGVRVFNEYGPTETVVGSCVYELEAGAEERGANGGVPIGRPIYDTQMFVLDQWQQPVAVGVRGEIYIGGAGLARGYWDRPDLTAERFVPHPHSTRGGERLYRTGDEGRYLEDGRIEYLGRRDQQVKLRGYRIELGEIESILESHAGVGQAVVLVREEQQLVAYVVGENWSGSEREVSAQLRPYLLERLPEYMVPHRWVALEQMPLTANGKVDRQALPAPSTDRALEWEEAGEWTAVEEMVAGIWCEVLKLESIGRDEIFFELGGHSLLATQAVSRVRQVFGVEVGLRRLFEAPTVRGLSRSIEEQLRVGDAVTVPPLQCLGADERERWGGLLPLSFAQQRLWFLNRLEPESGFYNIPAAVRLKGELQIEALERTLSEIVRRHEVLRTRFVNVGGEPRQEILEAAPIELPAIDLSSLTEEEREAAALEAVTAESRKPFDLSDGPMLRAKLLRLSDEEYVVLMTMHHIVSDGWSMGLLIKEVATLYEAYRAGAESPLTELPAQYSDFAVWQRGWLQGAELERQLEYWRQQLGRKLPVLELPTDRPRPAVQSFRGARLGLQFSSELSAGLRELSRREGVTLFMTLLAAFQTLLSRYSGQRDIVVGTDVANRNYRETEGLIGFFVNQLVLRTDLSGEPTFLELLRRVKDVCLGAYAHQDVPFEKLVEELESERDLSRAPLFQVKLVLQNAPGGQQQLQLSGLKLSRVGAEGTTAKFDMSLVLQEKNGDVRGLVEYRTELFDEARIEQMLQHFEVLLQGIVANPEQRLWELPLLREEELDRAISVWNDTRRDNGPVTTVLELFEAQVAARPDAVAVVCGTEQLNYRELNQRANQLAHYLRKQGVGPDVVVGLCMERSIEMVTGLLGILKAGGAYLPLDPDYPQQRLEYMLSDAQVGLVLTQKRLLNQLPVHFGLTIVLDDEWETIARESTDNPEQIIEAENLVYMIYTSGSTGKPKGVMVTHGGLRNLAAAQVESFGIDANARVLQFASLNFDASIFEMCMTFCNGGQLHLASSEQVLVGPALSELLQQQEITVATLPPTVLKQLTDGEEFRKLQTVIVAGEACGEELVEQWSEDRRFYNAYGPTETTVWATVEQCQRGEGRPPIGHAIDNVEVYVLDEWLNVVPVGARGEIYIGGAGLARGYWDRADLSAERFVPHPYSTRGGERLYRTGDEGRYLNDGRIDYLGRRDQQVKLRGYRIELGEIEAALESHSGVRQAVVAVRDEQQLVGYVVGENWSTSEQDVAAAELRDYLRDRLPEYMVPQRWLLLDHLPLTANGKIDRANLPAPDQNQTQSERRVPPRNNLERELIKIWKNCLKVEKVGVTDNFFDLGGHSLLLVELHTKLQDELDRKFDLLDLFKYPTIRTFVEFLTLKREDTESTEKKARRTRRKPSRKRHKALAKAAGSHQDFEVEADES